MVWARPHPCSLQTWPTSHRSLMFTADSNPLPWRRRQTNCEITSKSFRKWQKMNYSIYKNVSDINCPSLVVFICIIPSNCMELHLKSSRFWKARDLYSRAFLWAQRFLLPRQSEKVAISIRASSFVRNIFYSRDILQTRNLYSCAFLWAQCFLFARQSEKVEISIRASSFVNSVFYSRVILKNSQSLFTRLALRAAFSIRETIWKIAISIRASSFVRSVFYSRVVLKISQSLFARLSLSVAFSIRETIWTLAICIRALGCAFNNEYFDILIIQRSWVVVFFPFVYFKCNHVSARNTPREGV